MSTEKCREGGRAPGEVPVATITVSDTRTPDTDENGRFLREELEKAGYALALSTIVPDEPEQVVLALDAALDSGARVVLFNGGTGVATRDTTFEALSQRIERPLPGFGELFRMLSYEQVGAAAMLSRATAGVVGRSVLFSMPGSHGAVRLAWERLLAPGIPYLIRELDR